MNKVTVNLSNYDNNWYNPGAGWIKRFIWYYCNIVFMLNRWNPSSRIKVLMLRLFGAKIGKDVVIKPCVNVKYPWHLSIGNYSWIGEGVWIDNLAKVSIGNNVCISQGAMLLCGNHDYTDQQFGLMVGEIQIANGAWIGARAIVGPNVEVEENAVLTLGSVASKKLLTNSIYSGNPCQKIKERVIS